MDTIGPIESGRRSDPMYTFGEVARIVGLATQTVRNWILGRPGEDGNVHPPLLHTKIHEVPFVSFLQLIEIMVAKRLKNAERRKFNIVRQAHLNAKELYNLEYPFAHIRLESIGGHIVHYIHNNDPNASFRALDAPSQWSLPGMVVVQEVASEIEYAEDLAARWWPDGKGSLIVIDPLISAGAPTIAGRGVTAATICGRFHRAQESVDFIMQDFQLERAQVEAALRYGERLAA